MTVYEVTLDDPRRGRRTRTFITAESRREARQRSAANCPHHIPRSVRPRDPPVDSIEEVGR